MTKKFSNTSGYENHAEQKHCWYIASDHHNYIICTDDETVTPAFQDTKQYLHGGDQIKHVSNTSHHQIARPVKVQVCVEEDIDAEADDFIKQKHNRFDELSRLMSLRRGI